MDSSDEEMFLFQILLEEDEEPERKKRKHKIWLHEICQRRGQYGEFHHLMLDLKRDSIKFFNYFRMSFEKFEKLLNSVRDDLTKENTKFRRPVDPEERLAVCLRYKLVNSYINGVNKQVLML